MIPKPFIEEVDAKTDMVELVGKYVHLKPEGPRIKGKCPFCNSMAFVVSKQKQIYKCFGCQKGGGAISFTQELKRRIL